MLLTLPMMSTTWISRADRMAAVILADRLDDAILVVERHGQETVETVAADLGGRRAFRHEGGALLGERRAHLVLSGHVLCQVRSPFVGRVLEDVGRRFPRGWRAWPVVRTRSGIRFSGSLACRPGEEDLFGIGSMDDSV